MATVKSSLSTESPPFNPNQRGGGGFIRGGVGSSSASSNSPFPRSRSTSPYPEVENQHSNAVPKYTFEHNG